MKKLSISFAAAMAVASAAFAGDLQMIQKDNGHGQTVALYQRTEPQTVALYHSGQAVGTNERGAASDEFSVQQRDNGHGQQISLVRRD